ncbi:MAG: CooT family nickel-binding protein [Oscillospiraceae bacterium]|nr:CooT family nickel-binding protein [Oscillospiraceae bacterium]
MCLSTVLALGGEKPEPVCRNIASVRSKDGKLIFTDIMGVTTEVDAAIERIDLMENYIWIRKHE